MSPPASTTRAFAGAASLCAAGVALYAGVFWAVRFACYAPAYIDAETQLVLLAIVYFTIRGWYAPLIVVMITAAIVKESLPAFLLFTIVALYRRHAGRVDARTSLIVGALVILPVVTIGIVRVLVTTVSALDTGSAFELTSGYRSPATNAFLHRLDSGVAKHSLHMKGQAADISLPGRPLRPVYEAALAMRVGGVGYYPNDAFIHVDVGRIRRWQG